MENEVILNGMVENEVILSPEENRVAKVAFNR